MHLHRRLLRTPRRAATFLLLAGNFACGGAGDTTRPPIEDVASVVITGAPATMMMVGDSVRLVAAPVNATGSIVANQQVAWATSAPTVAVIRENGTVLAIGSGHVTITASAGGQSGTTTFDVADGALLGTQGGVLRAAGGVVTLTVPAGSLAQATLIVIRPPATAPSDARFVPGTAFEIGPDGTRFGLGATLAVTYDAAKVPAGLAQESLQLCGLSGANWVVVPNSKVDMATKKVTGAIYGAGVYMVRSTPVDHITLIGAAAGGALYVGQGASLHATLYTATNDTLPQRTMSWSSSDASKVTVDAAGAVRGIAPGTATITATTDGKSGTATITVLTRPTADWSRATDWTTFQGDARHSGFIDATLDPGAFQERWVVTPVAGASYYQPTVGGGRVYLAMSAYFTAQQLIALDPANGTRQWVRDFGSIFGINQPTYDNGSLYITTGGHEDTFMYALNETDGSLRFQMAFPSQWEHWKAPVVSGSTIVTAGGYYGGLVGFNRATGATTFSMSGPQVDGWAPAAANGLVYTTGYVSGGGVRGIDPTTGTVSTELIDSRLAAVTTPVIGGTNDLLTITGNRLVAVDLGANRVAWEQSGSYTGMPVVGGGVVYGFSGSSVTARRESDGAALWSWTAPAQFSSLQTMVLTNNVLFVGATGGYNSTGITYAIDLASHLVVWSYPMNGGMALGKDGTLYIVQGSKVAAIAVK